MSVTGQGQVSQRTSLLVLVSIVAILLSAMAMVHPLVGAVQASHEDDLELVAPGANSAECEGYDYGWKLDNMDQLSAGVYTASDENHTVWIEIELFENGGNEVNDYTILDSDPAISDIFVKQPNEGGGISHLTFCYDTEATPTPTPTPTPMPTPTPTASPDDDNASLNVRKVDEDNNRLAGAVFTVEGIEGTFTTGDNGHFCITGLPNDSVWLVTEIQAPEGYEIADPAWQMVEVDDDGDCRSPDAVFVNGLAATPTPTPTPTPSESEGGGTVTPTPTPTPREDTEGGNPTPAPSGGSLPDTSMTAAPTLTPVIPAIIALMSLMTLGMARLSKRSNR
jgi:hypothetical protein